MTTTLPVRIIILSTRSVCEGYSSYPSLAHSVCEDMAVDVLVS